MTDPHAPYRSVRVAASTVVPLLVLAVALFVVDPVLLAGAALALGATFCTVYAYARYVELGESGRLDAESDDDGEIDANDDRDANRY